MFSLNNNKIYKILVPESAIGFYNGDPIRIGNTGNSNGIWINSGKIHESCSTREGGGVGAYTGEGGGPTLLRVRPSPSHVLAKRE